MSDDSPRVVAATFHTYRPVPSRKVLQIVFEVPLEKDGETLATLGYPNSAEPNWYAIARLQESPRKSAVKETGGVEKPKRKFNDLPLAQQCALLCDDADFINFLHCEYASTFDAFGTVAQTVRHLLCVKSRSELGKGNHDADNRYRKLKAEFDGWDTDRKYNHVRR